MNIFFCFFRLFKANGFGRVFGPKNYIGDKVGCGIIFDRDEDEEGHKPTAKVFFTRNGKEVSLTERQDYSL